MTFRLGQKVRLQRDKRVGEIVRLRRFSGKLYATVAWVSDQTWTMDAPTSNLVAA